MRKTQNENKIIEATKILLKLFDALATSRFTFVLEE
jgi:hypothetical protein